MSVFITVGTTSFDQLIFSVNKPAFHARLYELGYRDLVVQYGAGQIKPCSPTKESLLSARTDKTKDVNSLTLTDFRYKSNLDEEFERADLVICHGGAGSCLQALTPPGRRRLIIVINEALMGNHQCELAQTFSRGKHALMTTPEDLMQLLITGEQCYKQEKPLLCSKEVIRFLGPKVPPEEAGFVGFQRGDPGRLVVYLNDRLGLSRC